MKIMAIFQAYIAPQVNLQGSLSQFDELSSLTLVEDKKSIWALIFPIIWLVWNRLWFWLAVYILVSIFLFLLTSIQVPIIVSLLSIIPGLYLFLEGSSLIVTKLERQGWQFAGVVDAPDVEIAEYKFLASNSFDDNGQENIDLSIDSSVEPIISVDEKSNPSNPNKKPNVGDRPSIGIFSEG